MLPNGLNSTYNIKTYSLYQKRLRLFLVIPVLFLVSLTFETAFAQQDTSLQVNRAKKTDLLPGHLWGKKGKKKYKILSTPVKPSKKILAISETKKVFSKISDTSEPEVKIKSIPIKQAMASFFKAMLKVTSGQTLKPVTILHLGDNHIARDQFTGHLRQLLQSRFGNSGRGMVMPGPVFPFYRADGINFKSTGKWTVKTSMSGAGGPYGITGATYTSSDPKASLQMTTTSEPFSWTEVSFLTGPTLGNAIIWVEGPSGSHQRIIETKTHQHGIRRVRFPSTATSVSVFPEGAREITILSWQTGHDRPGVRYVNLGFPEATASMAQNLDAEFVKRDLDVIKPDLVVLSYGYKEGFDDNINLKTYDNNFNQLIQILKSLLPQASFLIIGPPDAAYLPKFASTGSLNSSKACRVLSKQERKNYHKQLKSQDIKLARWFPPLNLKSIRSIMKAAAANNNAFFWDWSNVMGGGCGIHTWVHSKPQLASDNHRTLTKEGAKQSAYRLYSELMSGFDSYRLFAKK